MNQKNILVTGPNSFVGKNLIKELKKKYKVFTLSIKKKELKIFGKKTEWVVTFDNEKGVKGKKLYIFLKLSGEFVAANFTGK